MDWQFIICCNVHGNLSSSRAIHGRPAICNGKHFSSLVSRCRVHLKTGDLGIAILYHPAHSQQLTEVDWIQFGRSTISRSLPKAWLEKSMHVGHRSNVGDCTGLLRVKPSYDAWLCRSWWTASAWPAVSRTANAAKMYEAHFIPAPERERERE
eukprot:scpid89797/ scgid2008/ 